MIKEGYSKSKLSKDFHKIFIQRENSFIVDSYYTQTVNIFTFECNFETYSFQKILDITISFFTDNNNCDLVNLITLSFKDNKINWNTKYLNCTKIRDHNKTVKFNMINDMIIFFAAKIW